MVSPYPPLGRFVGQQRFGPSVIWLKMMEPLKWDNSLISSSNLLANGLQPNTVPFTVLPPVTRGLDRAPVSQTHLRHGLRLLRAAQRQRARRRGAGRGLG